TRGESAPIRMMAPFPQVFSICVIARLRAFLRSSESCGTSLSAAMSILDIGWEPRLVRPEYTPKPRLSPPGAECVGQVLQLAVHDRDAVEPIDVRRLPEAVQPDPRRLPAPVALVGPLRRVGSDTASHRRKPTDPPPVHVTETMPTGPYQCGMSNAECGVYREGRIAKRNSRCHSAFRIPHLVHSAFRIRHHRKSRRDRLIPPARPAASIRWPVPRFPPAPAGR